MKADTHVLNPNPNPNQVAAKGLRLEWLGHRTRVLGLATTVLD